MSRKSRFRRNLVDLGNDTWFVDLEKTHGLPMTMSFELAPARSGAGIPGAGMAGTGPDGTATGNQADSPSGSFLSGMSRADRRRQAGLTSLRDPACRPRLSPVTGKLTRKKHEAAIPQPAPEPVIPSPAKEVTAPRSGTRSPDTGSPVKNPEGRRVDPGRTMPEPEPGGTFRSPVSGAGIEDSSPGKRSLAWQRLPWVVFSLLAALVTTLFAGLGMSCAPDGIASSRKLSLMTWNLQNLFDGNKDGGEYTEFTPPQWTYAAYHKRLENLAGLLALLPGRGEGSPYTAASTKNVGSSTMIHGSLKHQDNSGGSRGSCSSGGVNGFPHLLVFQELENKKVLGDLASALADQTGPAFPYTWLDTCPKVEDSPITTGILAWKAPSLQKTHRVWVDGSSTRLVWELHFDLGAADPVAGSPGGTGGTGETGVSGPGPQRLVLFANHWKSKSGDTPDAESLRTASARVVRERTENLLRDGIPTVFVCAGDLNTQGLAGESGEDLQALLALEDWQGGSTGLDWLQSGSGRRKGELCLVPPDWTPADLARATTILDSAGLDPSHLWTEPWLGSTSREGSYFYDGNWERIDHLLVRSGGAGQGGGAGSTGAAGTLAALPAGGGYGTIARASGGSIPESGVYRQASGESRQASGISSGTAHPLGSVRIGFFGVPAIEGLADQSGLPRRYTAASGTGISDHLPLLLSLELD